MIKRDYFLDVDEKYTRLENSKFTLLQVNYDGTSTFVKGADYGPQAIIDASDSLELYDCVYDFEAYKEGIYTDNYKYDFSTPQNMVLSVYERVKTFIEKDKIVGILGGEHSVSVGAIKAHAEKYNNMSVLQIDAHADMRNEYNGSKFNHACVMRRASEITASVVQVGIRNVCAEEKQYIIPENTFYAHNIYNDACWISKAVNRLSENVYLTIDLDGFDPSIVPATGTPLPGGLDWYLVIALLENLFKNKNVVGFDVVELCPQKENKISDVLAATLVYKIITLSAISSLKKG